MAFQSRTVLGTEQRFSLRLGLEVLRELSDARKPEKYSWKQSCPLRLIRHGIEWEKTL